MTSMSMARIMVDLGTHAHSPADTAARTHATRRSAPPRADAARPRADPSGSGTDAAVAAPDTAAGAGDRKARSQGHHPPPHAVAAQPGVAGPLPTAHPPAPTGMGGDRGRVHERRTDL